MTRRVILIPFLLITLLSGTVFSLRIVATINPYYLIVKEIVGQNAQVDLLIGPGQNPHIFSPKISDIRRLDGADLVIANGLDLEIFLERYLDDLASRGKTVVYIGNLLPKELIMEKEEQNEEQEHDHHVNPHIWLDPVILTDYVIPFLVEALSEIAPEKSGYFSANAAQLIDDLQEFDEEANSYLEKFRGSVVIVAHPSFTYFFRRYGLRLEPVLEGIGDEPTIGEIKKLVDFVRGEEVVGIFAEYQHSKRAIDILTAETSVRHGELDSLGISMSGIIELLQWNLGEIKRVFDGE